MTAGEKCYKLEKRQGERRLHLRREGDRGVRGGTKGQEGVTIQTAEAGASTPNPALSVAREP